MLEALERHWAQAQTEQPIGYAVAIVGTARSCWVTATEEGTSYEESDAQILPNQEAARQFAQDKGMYERFEGVVRTVPALASVAAKRPGSQGLPTVSGYAPHQSTDPKLLTHDQYLWVSSICYAIDGKEAYLVEPTAATALLLQLADQQRTALQDLPYDPFCEHLKRLADTRHRFPIEGKSPNWIAAFQFLHNSPSQTLLLRRLLELQSPITLPITPTTLDNMGLPSDHELRSAAGAIAMFTL